MIMDRLSDLPDGILHHIYSWMPMEEVVRTSLLSKRWNGLWLSSPDLYFQLRLHNRPEDFTEFVNRALIFRGCSKVRLRINTYMRLSYTRHLDLWIRYALENNAEHLWLDLRGDHSFYIPPQFCYFSSSLSSVRLQKCNIRIKRGVAWTLLKNLVLQLVILSGDVIHQVLLGCPRLESLELLDCGCYDVLSIYSSSLKSLVISDSTILCRYKGGSEEVLQISAPNVESICMSGDLYRKFLLKDLSSLLHVTLNFFGRIHTTTYYDDEQVRLLDVLKSVEHVKNLKLGEWCIKVLSVRDKKGLPCRPLKCKCLILNTSLKQEDIPGILLLLKCSPDLETLTLNITSPTFERYLYESKVGILADFCNFNGDHYLNSEVVWIPCLRLKLRTINITHFVDQNLVLPFIKFMLKEARVLKNMEIRSTYLDPNSPLDSFFNVARELSATPKSSPNVVVKLHNFDGKVTLMIY